jgi:hypothetical protein
MSTSWTSPRISIGRMIGLLLAPGPADIAEPSLAA